MIHIIYNAIYLTVIVFLFIWLCRAYDFANRKHKELINYKEFTKGNRNILNHYNKACKDFLVYMYKIYTDSELIEMYKQIFKYKK